MIVSSPAMLPTISVKSIASRAAATLPASGVVLVPLKLAKGLEFDHVIVPDASERAFPDDPLSRRRLYTTVSRATRGITLLAQGEVTPLLAGRA